MLQTTRQFCLLVLFAIACTTPELKAAFAPENFDEQHNDCCVKRMVEAYPGNRMEERWLCYLKNFQCSYGCEVNCADCNHTYICGSVEVSIVACTRVENLTANLGPQCSQTDYAADAPVIGLNDCHIAGFLHDCANPCDDLNCKQEAVDEECARKCGDGGLPE